MMIAVMQRAHLKARSLVLSNDRDCFWRFGVFKGIGMSNFYSCLLVRNYSRIRSILSVYKKIMRVY